MKITNEQWQSLYRYSVALCGDRDDALDLLHSAIERLLRVKCADILEPEAYLRRVIRNLQYDRWRKEKAHPSPVSLEAAEGLEPVSLDEHCLENTIIARHRLSRIWQDLSPQERDILYLWAWLGYSTQAAADELNLPKGTLLAKIHRLREKLLAAEKKPSDSFRATP